MLESGWMFVALGGGLLLLFTSLVAYGMIVDLRQGKTGILMSILAIVVVAGLFLHETLAIVATTLFAAAWIVAALHPLIQQAKRTESNKSPDCRDQ